MKSSLISSFATLTLCCTTLVAAAPSTAAPSPKQSAARPAAAPIAKPTPTPGAKPAPAPAAAPAPIVAPVPAAAVVRQPVVSNLCAVNPAACRVVTLPAPTCPDPAASVSFRIVRRDSPYQGLVAITAQVRNAGSNYLSGANQQSLYLYEIAPGGAPRIVARAPFQNLLPGATQSVTFTRNWYSASPAEGEFPPTYRAVIGYDPDILLDSNPNNDDCRSSNNSIERSGSAINELFYTTR